MGRDPRGKADNGRWGRPDAGAPRRTTPAAGDMAAGLEGRQLWLQLSQLNSQQTERVGLGHGSEMRAKLGRKSRMGGALASACSLSGFVSSSAHRLAGT